jgi:hypothetical protein
MSRRTRSRAVAAALILAVVAASVWAQGQKPAAAQAARQDKPAPAARGMHFMFDASGSMCGYLRTNDTARTLLTLIKFATSRKDEEKNHRVLLIRQADAKPSAKDIADAPANFQALVDSPHTEANNRCAPFDGRDSNVDLMFTASASPVPARSMVLVSDMQLDETALISFVDRFRGWARAQGTGHPVSAGLVTLRAPFAGRYYPVSDTDKTRQHAGYLLPEHVRPLSVLWFAAGAEDIASVRELLGELGLLKAPRPSTLLYGLQLLPVESEEPADWLQGTAPLAAATALFNDGALRVIAPNTARDRRQLQDCAGSKLTAGELQVVARPTCRDGKPFFETVQGLEIALPIDGRRGLDVAAADAAAAVKDGKLVFTLTRTSPAQQEIPLLLAPRQSALHRDAISALTLDNDACDTRARAASGASEGGWEKRCADKLGGKVYRYEALVLQLAARARGVAAEQAAATKLSLKIRFTH